MRKFKKSVVTYAVGALSCLGAVIIYASFSGHFGCAAPKPFPELTLAPQPAQAAQAAPAPPAPASAQAPPAPVPPEMTVPESSTAAVGSPPPPGSYAAVGLAAVADRAAQWRFAVSIASQRCYAERHGYEFAVLDPSDYPACRQRDFFFRKHCTVARFLEKRPPDYILFVLDGDNPAVVLDRNLDQWLAEMRSTDVLLYERWMNNEIMAGNYAVRNSKWGIDFCDGWAAYDSVDQPKGYHSSDNGAIHLHVLRSLQISNWEHCSHLWDRLEASVMNLDPYYAFVACSRELMGAPRRWKVNGQRRVTILPRGHAWSIDGVVANGRTAPVGAVTHHGQKTTQNYLQYFQKPFVDGPERSCGAMLRDGVSVDAATYYGFLTRSLHERVKGSFQAWSRQAPPPWDFAYLDCIRTLSCRPLDDEVALPVLLPRPEQGALPFLRVPRGASWRQCAREWEPCGCAGLVRFGTLEDKKLSSPLRVAAGAPPVRCSADTFAGHDPNPGVGKKCYCAEGT